MCVCVCVGAHMHMLSVITNDVAAVLATSRNVQHHACPCFNLQI